MGQYYCIVNFDKKEVIVPEEHDCGAKLMEWAYQGNPVVNTLLHLLRINQWKTDDRIAVMGEYWKQSGSNHALFEEVCQELGNPDDVCGYIYDNFKHIKEKYQVKSELDIFVRDNEYFNCKMQPIQWGGYDKEENVIYGAKIHPLPLLLCTNNSDGGSYFGVNKQFVGCWLDGTGLGNKNGTIVFDEENVSKDNMFILLTFVEQAVENGELTLDALDTLDFDEWLFLTDFEKDFLKNCARNLLTKEAKGFDALKEIIEEEGWAVHCDEDFWTISQLSPAGEDLSFDIDNEKGVKDLIRNICQYCDGFDVDDHVEMLVRCKAENPNLGVPSVTVLVEDAKQIKEMLDSLKTAISNC